MNKKGLFGINIFLILVAFVAGVILGGYLVVKADGALKSITGFFSSDSLGDNLNNFIDDTNYSVDSGNDLSGDVNFEGLGAYDNASGNDSNLTVPN